jgi:hypothetical protein
MRSHASALGGFLFCLSLLSACSNNGDDYQVVVSWLINGTTPNQDMCQEHGIARARFEVRSQSGSAVKTIEGNCADTITLSTGDEYGGFYTNNSFDWDVRYNYTLTLVDAAGNAVSQPASSSFQVAFDDADIYELDYLDYVNPIGKSASLTGEWQFSNGTASSVAADCAAQRVTKVRILATSALDDPDHPGDAVTVAEADCTAGSFISNGSILATGDYFFYFQAISDTGSIVTTTKAEEQFVDFNTRIVLMRASFFGN